MQPDHCFNLSLTQKLYLDAAILTFHKSAGKNRLLYCVFAAVVLLAAVGMVAVMSFLSGVLGRFTGILFFLAEAYLFFSFVYFLVLATVGDCPKQYLLFRRLCRYHRSRELALTVSFYEDHFTVSTDLLSCNFSYGWLTFLCEDERQLFAVVKDPAGMSRITLPLPRGGCSDAEWDDFKAVLRQRYSAAVK